MTATRGRPRLDRGTIDYGTPELQRKRSRKETIEILDFYLEKGIISEDQHWCGMHLRWLHTLRYGATSIQALNLVNPFQSGFLHESDEWRRTREQEYSEAIERLRIRRCDQEVIKVAVYNENILFPYDSKQRRLSDNAKYIESYEMLSEGLNILAMHWYKKPASKIS